MIVMVVVVVVGGRRKGRIGHDDGADNVTSGHEIAMIVVSGNTSSGNAEVTVVIDGGSVSTGGRRLLPAEAILHLTDAEA